MLKPTRKSDGPQERLLILLVDDERPSRAATAMAIRHLGYEVEEAVDAKDALQRFDAERHVLVVTDNRMPGASGADLAAEIRQRSPGTPIVMYTGFAPPRRPPVDCLLDKPVELTTLDQVLQRLLHDR